MAEPTLTIEIFDPPMCCPTGLCGPAIDPALLDIHEAILRVKREYDGRAKVERYLLGQQPAKFMQQPAKFMQQPAVIARLKVQGIPVLPITVVNGRVVKERAYPTYEELAAWIGRAGDD